ncbi:UPF0481 protein [Nymphaea thermarum]|nr:UPF0481 protein [Nymphaea thermarum]
MEDAIRIDVDNAVATSPGGSGNRKCIFKWPQDLVHHLGEGIRVPQMVAIGPYHHGQENLMVMEDYKRKALDRVLHLSGGLQKSKFVEALKQVEQKLRDHYEDLDSRWSSDSFIEMMLLDGCFLLDFLFKFDEKVKGSLAKSKRRELLCTPGCFVLNRDIHLLENQIPLLVLEVLMNVAGGDFRKPSSERKLFSEALHLLNLQRMSLLGKNLFPSPRGFTTPFSAREENLQAVALETLWTIRRRDKYLRSAKTLRLSGVTFKKSKPETGLSGVRFDKGVLYLPEIELNAASEGVLMNMVAFEQMHSECERGITSFMSFMDVLIDTAEDVSILGKAGIVTNSLGSDELAANIFNRLSVLQMCSPFDKVLKEVVTYASVPRHSWWVHFKDTYLANPWTILSLTGALCLLFLTAVQTVYTALSYLLPN